VLKIFLPTKRGGARARCAPLGSAHDVIPTKWLSYRGHRFCDVTSPCVFIATTNTKPQQSTGAPTTFELLSKSVNFVGLL